MTKTELIEKVAKDASLTKADTSRAQDNVIETITKAMKKGDKATLVGFGTFSVSKGRHGPAGIPGQGQQ